MLHAYTSAAGVVTARGCNNDSRHAALKGMCRKQQLGLTSAVVTDRKVDSVSKDPAICKGSGSGRPGLGRLAGARPRASQRGASLRAARLNRRTAKLTIIGNTENWIKSEMVVICVRPMARWRRTRLGQGQARVGNEGASCVAVKSSGLATRGLAAPRGPATAHGKCGGAGLGLAGEQEEHAKPARRRGGRRGVRKPAHGRCGSWTACWSAGNAFACLRSPGSPRG